MVAKWKGMTGGLNLLSFVAARMTFRRIRKSQTKGTSKTEQWQAKPRVTMWGKWDFEQS